MATGIDWRQMFQNVAGSTAVQYPTQPVQPILPQQSQQLGGLAGLGASMFYSRPVLSDFDIELMAICIANKHPQMEGHAGCFCMMKRLEKGISKD